MSEGARCCKPVVFCGGVTGTLGVGDGVCCSRVGVWEDLGCCQPAVCPSGVLSREVMRCCERLGCVGVGRGEPRVL